jgi:hypothetical protein
VPGVQAFQYIDCFCDHVLNGLLPFPKGACLIDVTAQVIFLSADYTDFADKNKPELRL